MYVTHFCKRCHKKFKSNNYFFDENGFGYSTKLVKCPDCGNYVVVDIIEDYALEVMDECGLDERYYERND